MGMLTGMKVLDLSRILAGPYITMSLGDLGAEIIKIENPHVGDDTRHWGPPFIGDDSTYYLATNRNKRSVTVNLKHEEGRRLIYEMVKGADVVVENFRTETRDKFGMDYETLKQHNPSLIMLHISAFGEKGPYQHRPGYDLLAQAMGGLMSLTGQPEGPPVKAGFAFADLGAAMFGLSGILAALVHRERTGEGMYLATSLYESQLAYHINWAMNYFVSKEDPKPLGSAHPNLAPYQAYPAADGYFVVACGNDGLWKKLCHSIGRTELIDDERFGTNASRVMHREELEQELIPTFQQRTIEEWCNALEEAGVPSGPICTLSDIYEANEQTEALGIVQSIQHPVAGLLRQIAFPVNFSSEPAQIQCAPPLLGQHTSDVLGEMGYDSSNIERLRNEGVI